MLNTIGKQLDRVECSNNREASTSKSKKININENPIFVPYNLETPINLGKQNSILKEIEENLSKLHINYKINVINYEISYNDDISKLEEKFKNKNINKIRYNLYT